MDEKTIRETLKAQARNLKPASEIRDLTESKILSFAGHHLERIIIRINAAVDLGRYQTCYEFLGNSNEDILAIIKQDLITAGYSVCNQKHPRDLTWNISWLPLSTENTTPTTSI